MSYHPVWPRVPAAVALDQLQTGIGNAYSVPCLDEHGVLGILLSARPMPFLPPRAAADGNGQALAALGSSARMNMSTGPVSIGDLRRDGRLLELGCVGCSRHIYIDPAKLPLPDGLPVPETAAWLACSQCGAINQETWHPIWARPDARVPGVL